MNIFKKPCVKRALRTFIQTVVGKCSSNRLNSEIGCVRSYGISSCGRTRGCYEFKRKRGRLFVN